MRSAVSCYNTAFAMSSSKHNTTNNFSNKRVQDCSNTK
jgi:hypothetical protein